MIFNKLEIILTIKFKIDNNSNNYKNFNYDLKNVFPTQNESSLWLEIENIQYAISEIKYIFFSLYNHQFSFYC